MDPIPQPSPERIGFFTISEAQKITEGEGRIPHPDITVVPISTSADVLRYAEEVTRNVVVSDELFDRLRQKLTEEELVELAATVALANFTNRISETLRLELP